jgi:hypothetical protein
MHISQVCYQGLVWLDNCNGIEVQTLSRDHDTYLSLFIHKSKGRKDQHRLTGMILDRIIGLFRYVILPMKIYGPDLYLL